MFKYSVYSVYTINFLHMTSVAGDVYDGDFLCGPFSHEMSWMRSETELSQFLRVFLPTLSNDLASFIFIEYIFVKLGLLKILYRYTCESPHKTMSIATEGKTLIRPRWYACSKVNLAGYHNVYVTN